MAKRTTSSEADTLSENAGDASPSTVGAGGQSGPPAPAAKRFTIRGKAGANVPDHARLERVSKDLAYCDSAITADTLRQRGFEVIDNETGQPYDGTRHAKA